MGNEMNKVLSGLFIGSARDAHDICQLTQNKISHILAIHENAKPDLPDKEYMCVSIPDTPLQNIATYFTLCNDYIHKARHQGNVLVHCQMGISRSATVIVAYLMTVSHCGWKEALGVLKTVRPYVNPNLGFQKQLMVYEKEHVEQERMRLSRLNLEKRSEDFVESFKLLSILSCSRLGAHDRQVEDDSDLYPLALNAYGIKESPFSTFSPSAVTFREPLTDSASVTASDLALPCPLPEKRTRQVSFGSKTGSSPKKKSTAKPSTDPSQAAGQDAATTKKDSNASDEKVMTPSSEDRKNLRNKHDCCKACDSADMTPDAVRQIGREYLQKHVRIWRDLSDVDDENDECEPADEDDSKIEIEDGSVTSSSDHRFDRSECNSKDEASRLVDDATQTTAEDDATQTTADTTRSHSRYVDDATQTTSEDENRSLSGLAENASSSKIPGCFPLAGCVPKSSATSDNAALMASLSRLDLPPQD